MSNQDFHDQPHRRPIDYDEANIGLRRTQPSDDGQSYLAWIVGGVLVLALLIGVYAGRSPDTNTATNSSAPTSSSETAATNPTRPSETTGSGNAGNAPAQAPAR
jgi:hypothetical protein